MSIYDDLIPNNSAKDNTPLKGSIYDDLIPQKTDILKTEAEQSRIKAEQMFKPSSIAKETIKGLPSSTKTVGKKIWGGIKSLGGYLKEAIQQPTATGRGIVREAVLKPTTFATELLGKATGSEKIKKLGKLEREGLKQISEAEPYKKAEKVGEFAGWMIPYTATEKAISAIPKFEKLGKLAPIVKQAGAWITTNQVLYNPETDGSRVKTALEDLVAFGVLKGIGKYYKMAKGDLPIKIADEMIKPVEKAMKSGQKVPVEVLEEATQSANKIIQRGTGKTPKQIIKEEVLPTKQTPEPLAKEARRYKTVEEFIKDNNKKPKFLFRGIKKGMPNEGLMGETWVTSDFNSALKYAGKDGKVLMTDYNKNIKGQFVIESVNNISQFQGKVKNPQFTEITKSQLTDIFNQAKGIKPKTKEKIEPLIKTSRLAKSVKSKAIRDKIIYGFDRRFRELPDYDKNITREKAVKATEYVLNSPKEAFEAAMRRTKPPKGLFPEDVYVAMNEYATNIKDVDMIIQLATKSGLVREATEMGQRIQTLSRLQADNPARLIKEVGREKIKALGGKEKVKGIIKSQKAKIKGSFEKSTKAVIKKNEWGDFISSITC